MQNQDLTKRYHGFKKIYNLFSLTFCILDSISDSLEPVFSLLLVKAVFKKLSHNLFRKRY